MDEISAYAKAYGTKNRKICLTSLANKRKRNPEMFQKITEYKGQVYDTAKEAHMNAVTETAKESVLTAIEKRQFLRQILENKVEMEEVLVSGIKIKRVKRKPTNMEKLRALQLDNLMAGHLAPTGYRHEGQDPFIEFFKIVHQTSNQAIPNPIVENNK